VLNAAAGRSHPADPRDVLPSTTSKHIYTKIGVSSRAAAAIPGARVQVLEGHAHLAYRTDPAMVAAVIRRFVSGRGCRGCGRPRRS
jgi:pimeloyl-ACP methyl ester carboxylesterase